MKKLFWIFSLYLLSSCQTSMGKPSNHDLRPSEFMQSEKPLIWPTEGPVSSEFGVRWGKTHKGLDITGNKGQKILAAAGGTVGKVGWVRGYGHTIVLEHKGFKTLYAHLQQSLVKKGTTVKQGQQIALLGKSGNAQGFHLHFEVRSMNNKNLNPRNFLPLREREYVLFSQI